MPSLPEIEETLAAIDRIDVKYKPVWDGFSKDAQVALARYFLAHRSSKPVLAPTRPRVVKWYCPFASQAVFPSGHRYCINVFAGCGHRCVYCYVNGYRPGPPTRKREFRKLISRDMADLDRFDVPPAPVHLSNSTDPFQPLEIDSGDTKFALEQILRHRDRFTKITILTKNPLGAIGPDYLAALEGLDASAGGGVAVQVSLAFNRPDAIKAYEPGAPSIDKRLAGIRRLREAGIAVVLRIDPLFPCSAGEVGLLEAQTPEDLTRLVGFAADAGVSHIVYSVAKIVRPRGRKVSGIMATWRSVYEELAGAEGLIFRGGSYRLPEDVAQSAIVGPFLDICERYGVRAKHCKEDLLGDSLAGPINGPGGEHGESSRL